MSQAVTAAKMPLSTNTPTRTKRAIEAISVLGVPVEMIFWHFEKRRFDLSMAVAMLGVAVLLEPSIQATLILAFGLLRIVALWLNGHWMPNGAYARAVCAGVGAFMWGQWAAALWERSHSFPPEFAVFTALAFFEVVSIYSALVGAWWREHGKVD